MLGSVDEATDALQDAFIKAWKSLHRFDVSRSFGPWFFQILRNQCRDVIRSRQSRERLEVRDEHIEIRAAGPSTDPACLHERNEAGLILWKGLNALAHEHREILVLKELQGFRYSEIADILQIPEGTVASRLYHARDALREALVTMNAEYP
jgi:RNA polymerase sigma-70 factor (ECF subfamily)